MVGVVVVAVTNRVLGVLALTLGLVTMHAVAGSHAAHAAPAHAAPAHAAPADSPAATSSATSTTNDCGHSCAPDDGTLAQVCLMVLVAVTLLLIAGSRPATTSWRHRVQARVPSALHALGQIARPPSLVVLCISRT